MLVSQIFSAFFRFLERLKISSFLPWIGLSQLEDAFSGLVSHSWFPLALHLFLAVSCVLMCCALLQDKEDAPILWMMISICHVGCSGRVLGEKPVTFPFMLFSSILWHFYSSISNVEMGFPDDTSSQEPTCQCKRYETWVRSLSREDPWRGNGNPLKYPCLENPVDRGAWRATVHEVTKCRNMTEMA